MLSCLLGAACAEAPAVRSRWNFHPRRNVVHTAVETIHGPTDHAVPPPLCAAWSCSRDMSARTIDVKLSFDRFDGIAGPACRIFRRNLLQYGPRQRGRGAEIGRQVGAPLSVGGMCLMSSAACSSIACASQPVAALGRASSSPSRTALW